MVRRWLVRGGLLVAALLAVSLVLVSRGVGRGPDVTGTLTLSVLEAPVEVYRDAHGIPYVFARSLPDLIRAQGFVTGQHRLFQLESYRALATGRLAEVIGEAGLASDREMRLLGLRRNAVRHAARLSASSRAFFQWYVDGLNAYIREHAADHPVELRLAGFGTSPWTLEDLVTILHFTNYSQAANFKAELLMQKLVDHLGAETVTRELLPVTVNPDRLGSPPQPLGLSSSHLLIDVGDPAPAWSAPLEVGSNNWAVAAGRSASGAAVLVNDPHLDARMLPGPWLPIGLFSPEVQAIGAALPAVPGLLVGRTAHVAFGVTNGYGDSQDLFIETLAPGDPGAYLEGGTPRRFEVSRETIRVRDRAAPGGVREEPLEIRMTARGPIVTGPILGYGGDKLLSLRMASAEIEGREIGLDRLLVARTVDEVDRALQAVEVMYFNFVFADAAGDIGFRTTGRVPIRTSGHGIYPKPAEAADDWQGFIPPDRMPGVLRPARGWVGTANHDTVPDGYPFHYSSYFSPAYRYRRMAEVLDASSRLTTADHAALMLDTVNLQARHLRPLLIDALAAVPEMADWVGILREWDDRDDHERAAPLIYHRLYERLAFETFVDDLGEPLARAYLAQWYVWQERFDRLVTDPRSAWFDDRRTPQVETLPDLIRRAAAAVRAELEARHGPDPRRWQWGSEHRIAFFSPLRPSGWGRDLLGFGERPMSGSGETLMRARTAFQGDGRVEFFASMRFVADLGDREKIEAVVSGGVTDRQFHRHQQDQLPAWTEGRLLPWWFDPERVKANARSRQVLEPPQPR